MRVELRDSLENLHLDSVVGQRPRRAMSIDVARGGTAAVHVLLNDVKTGAAIRAVLRGRGGVAQGAEWSRLIDVPVEVNTGPVGFIEKEGERNRFVVRRAPFRTYDAIAPMHGSVKAAASTIALRLHLPIARSARPGRREYTIEIRSGRDTATCALKVNVHPPVVPPVGRGSFPYTNWFSFALMAERHGLDPWSPGHWRMIRRYAELMAHGRQNTFWVPQRDIFRKVRGRPMLDVDRLRRIVRTFTSAGMHYIEGGHFGSRSTGEWKCPTFNIGLTSTPAASVKGNADIACIAKQLMAEIERNGWRERWIQHIADEPIEENGADYRIFSGIVRKYMPGIPILDATMYEGLVGSVDFWCPQAQEYQRHRGRFDAQRALGDRVWFYTCCFPGGPWLNRLLDMELLRPALLGWAAALYDLDGFLHWGLNHYRPDQNPFAQSVVPHGGGTRLPAGDTHVVYPGTNGPWSSLRLEAQREGCEDYELLRELREQSPKAATTIIRKAIRGFDKYTRNVKTFRTARKARLEAPK